MKIALLHSLATRIIVGGAVVFASATVRADLRGPYTPDANTLYLFHFDEATGTSITPNAGSRGGNAITVTNTSDFNGLAGVLPTVTTLLGHASFTGFGNAVSGTNVDGSFGAAAFDGDGDGFYISDSGTASPDEIALTNLNIGVGAGNSPWTIEALIRPSTISGNQEIVCTDGLSGQRGFQFRISGGQLEFNMINGDPINPKFSIPTTGPHAFVADDWYHVALTYDGASLRMFWTKLDPAFGAANPIGSIAWNSTAASGAIMAPLVIANENRGGFGEPFRGLIDEVRISSVARAGNEMQFFSPAVTISQDPASQNIDNGQPVRFEVLASSTSELGFQWRFNGDPIPGAQNASVHTIAAVDLADAGNYDVVITNQSGSSATSQVAVLTVGAGNFLAHRWSFATDTSDSVGGATGTLQGNAVVSDGALVLDGTEGTFMDLPPFLLSGLTAVTFEFWATFGANADNNRVFDFGNTNFVSAFVPPPQNYVFFSPRAGGGTHNLGITGGSSESQQTLSGPGILDGQTVHVTVVVDPPNQFMAIYTNGVIEVSTTNLNVSLASLNDELAWIGRSLFEADPFLNGSIDELRIYAGALAAASVQQSEALGPDAVLSEGPVEFVREPMDTTSVAGQIVTFSGAATGHLPIQYQWFEEGSPIPGATNNTYSFTALAGQDGHVFQLRATNNVAGTEHFAISGNATLTLRVPETKAWIGNVNANWDTSTMNWVLGATTAAFELFDEAVFDSRGSAQPNVDLTQEINVTALTVDAATDYLLMSSAQNGSLTGVAPLVKQGAGALTIDVPNNMVGGTLIQGGRLQIGNGGGSGTLSDGPVTNNATLAFNRTNALTVDNVISGTGRLEVPGSGSVALTGSNSYSGLTVISAGTVNARNASALGTTAAGTVATNGGQLYVDVNVNIPAEPLTLGGNTRSALRKGGAGETTLGGTVTLVSDTMMEIDGGATLNLTNAGGITGSGVDLTLAGAGLTAVGNVSGPVSLGSGSLTNAGGAWRLSNAANNYGGGTYITGGRLEVGAASALGPAPGVFTADQINLNGGALGAFASFALDDGLRGITVGPDAGGGFYAADGATFTIANEVAGFLPLTKSGPGTVILSGANNNLFSELFVDTASATANDGALRIANNAAVANVATISILNNNGGQSTLQFDGSSGSISLFQGINLAGRNNATPAIDNLAGSNSLTGQITMSVGGSQYRIQATDGVLALGGFITTDATTDRTVTFQGAGEVLVTSGIGDGSAPVGVVKDGSGTLIYDVFVSYTGPTMISNGTLRVTSSGGSGSGPITVAGGRLSGSGNIFAPVTVLPGGAVAPGDSVGTITLTGDLTLAGGNLEIEVNKALSPQQSNDVLSVSGTLSNTGSGAVIVENPGPALSVGDRFVLFNGQALPNGDAMSVVGAGAVWQNNLAVDGSISVVSTAVSQPVIDQTGISGTNVVFSGSAGTPGAGYLVLSHTNVAVPTGEWPVISSGTFDGSGNFSVTNGIAPDEPGRFFIINVP